MRRMKFFLLPRPLDDYRERSSPTVWGTNSKDVGRGRRNTSLSASGRHSLESDSERPRLNRQPTAAVMSATVATFSINEYTNGYNKFHIRCYIYMYALKFHLRSSMRVTSVNAASSCVSHYPCEPVLYLLLAFYIRPYWGFGINK